MHTDEAVHAVTTARILEGGGFRYDPTDYHGPTLHFSTVPLALIRGQATFASLDELTLRAIPAVYGVALVLLCFAFRRELGTGGATVAAWLIALSPAMVFYSRYYIMEMMFVVFLGLTALGVLRWWQTRRTAWLVIAAIATGLLHATKETFVLHMAAGIGAVLLLHGRNAPGFALRIAREHGRTLLIAGLGAFALSSLLLSDFLRNPRAIFDGINTYFLYLQRAEGSEAGHLNPWYAYLVFYYNLRPTAGFWYSEFLVLPAAAFGVWSAFRWRDVPGGAFIRWLALYVLLGTLIYSSIPYKTPWSYLGIHHGVLILAAWGIARLLPSRGSGFRLPAVVGALALAAISTHAVVYNQRSFERPGAPAQPHVYGHTLPEFLSLVEFIEQLERTHERPMSLLVAEESNGWPLPWYRRHVLGHNRYGDTLPRPFDDPPDIVAVSRLHFPSAAQMLNQTHDQRIFPLRPGVNLHVYFRQNLLPDPEAAEPAGAEQTLGPAESGTGNGNGEAEE